MQEGRRAAVLIVSLGSTEGLRRADEELAEGLRRAGAEVEIVRARRPPERRTLVLTDLSWALAARAAARRALSERAAPAAIVYSSTTAALLWPRPGAIRFDAPAAGNRPGRHGLWQRPLERRRLAAAPLLLPYSEGALAEAQPAARTPAIVVPVPVRASGPAAGERDVAVVTYAANPLKKGTDRVLAAWQSLEGTPAREPADELLIVGAGAAELARAGVDAAAVRGVRTLGTLGGEEFRALLRRTRVFACAPRREDYGQSQLEALADGCRLVTTPAPGPYAALPIARALDPRLVAEDLAEPLRVALADPLAGYRERAAKQLAAYSPEAVDRGLAERVLPALLGEA
jgi:glycosyltransferase involved in cell wall biosynthesis